MAHNIAGRPEIAKFTYKEWGARFKSKAENYRFLTTEVGAYLPEYTQISMYFLKDILAGKKKCKSSNADPYIL